MRGVKINSTPSDLLKDGEPLIIIGELFHSDIDVKMYLYVLSSGDEYGMFISETQVKILDNDNIELSEKLRRHIMTLQVKFKENLKIYDCTKS